MPYLSKEETAKRRKAIRAEFPDYKISVRTMDYSSIQVNIKSGPIDLLQGAAEHDQERGYEQVNHFWYGDHYEDYPEKKEFLDKIMEIVNKGNGTAFVDGDYGNIPEFYVRISIGDWDSPYKVTQK